MGTNDSARRSMERLTTPGFGGVVQLLAGALLVAALALPASADLVVTSRSGAPSEHAGRSRPSGRPIPPPRATFNADDVIGATIPGIPDARFLADSAQDFLRAAPRRGPWLVLSAGGEDGAYGSGLLNGWTQFGSRPDFAAVTGVSSGALMAPFAFAGPRYDHVLREVYTTVTAADVFEAGGTGESLLDTWPLKDFIAKYVTNDQLADIAIQHRGGRRLFIVTTDLDLGRRITWNMGAIALAGDEAALKLFRAVLPASASIPGEFPPV